MVDSVWLQSIHYADAAKRITSKFKILRKHLKAWARSISLLKDEIEDASIDLPSSEANLRTDLKDHLEALLQKKRIYWQQRGKIKLFSLGGGNSNFFHSMATIQHRNNNIASLTNQEGVVMLDHDSKAQHLFEALKNRLGLIENITIPHELLQLPDSYPRLAFLEEPFTEKEIDVVVKDLPSNKSLGLDGFNTIF